MCENSSVTINAGANFDYYEWSTEASVNSEIAIHEPGNYWVKVTKVYGTTLCSQTKNFTVLLSGKAAVTSIDTHDFSSNQNTIKVNITGIGDYEFSIDGVNYQQSDTFTGLESGLYNVFVKDKNECGITRDKVFLLTYPTYFTPNNDSINDVWFIEFSAREYGLQTRIFDRYGKLIKQLNNGDTWDGTLNGQNLPATDYWFTITRPTGEQHMGHFSLIR